MISDLETHKGHTVRFAFLPDTITLNTDANLNVLPLSPFSNTINIVRQNFKLVSLVVSHVFCRLCSVTIRDFFLSLRIHGFASNH